MKIVKLTTWDRLQILRCVPPTDTLLNIPKHLRLITLLELTAEEKQEVDFVTAPSGDMTWKDTGRLFDVAFEDADFDHAMTLIRARKTWLTSELTVQLFDKMQNVETEE